jgi:hypothetical protein
LELILDPAPHGFCQFLCVIPVNTVLALPELIFLDGLARQHGKLIPIVGEFVLMGQWGQVRIVEITLIFDPAAWDDVEVYVWNFLAAVFA